VLPVTAHNAPSGPLVIPQYVVEPAEKNDAEGVLAFALSVISNKGVRINASIMLTSKNFKSTYFIYTLSLLKLA
jgi:hypothetical protein